MTDNELAELEAIIASLKAAERKLVEMTIPPPIDLDAYEPEVD